MKKKAFLNSASSLMAYIAFAILDLFVRRLFLDNFPVELLGYEGLFGSTFTLLSMAEMGAGSLFTYRLYSAIQKHDNQEISLIMSMFRQIYKAIGLFVAFAGSILFLCLPIVVREEVNDWSYVRLVFAVQMLCAISSYFLAYRRILLIANQEEYSVVTVDSLFRLGGVIFKIAIILFIKSYVMYCLVALFVNVGSNIVVYVICGKRNQYLYNVRVRKKDFVERGINKEIANIAIHKVSSTIYSSADNIIVSIICGIEQEALFTNYVFVNTGVMSLAIKTLQPLEATFGNKLCDGNDGKNRVIFKVYDFFGKMVAIVASVGFSTVFQTAITVFYGEKYLLPFSAILAISVNNYISISQYAIAAYRNGIGHYEIDRNSRIMSAVVNVLVSIVLGIMWGITGILIATVLGHLFIWYGRVKAVEKALFKEGGFTKEIFKNELIYIPLAIVEGVICAWVCNEIPVSWKGLFIKVFVCITIPVMINLILFHRKKEFLELKQFFIESLHKRSK